MQDNHNNTILTLEEGQETFDHTGIPGLLGHYTAVVLNAKDIIPDEQALVDFLRPSARVVEDIITGAVSEYYGSALGSEVLNDDDEEEDDLEGDDLEAIIAALRLLGGGPA